MNPGRDRHAAAAQIEALLHMRFGFSISEACRFTRALLRAGLSAQQLLCIAAALPDLLAEIRERLLEDFRAWLKTRRGGREDGQGRRFPPDARAG